MNIDELKLQIKVGCTVISEGIKYQVVSVGANYLTCMNESGIASKKWFTDIELTDEPFSFNSISFGFPTELESKIQEVFENDPYAAMQMKSAWRVVHGTNILKKKMMYEHLSRLFAKFDISPIYLSDIEDELIVESLTTGMRFKLSSPDKVLNILHEMFNINSNNTDLSSKTAREKELISKLLRLI